MTKLLLIDDDQKILDLLQLYLAQDNFTFLLANDGNEGMELFLENSVDLVIMDIFMPNMDGIQTIIEMKNKKNCCPILIISGGGELTGLEFLRQAKALGADEAMVKPFSKDELRKTVQSLLTGHGRS
ncbi:response regulator transcription factor [Maridesulfovibrio bastinii]|jgi:DNA-binding response OmpR family regulator|uniref:response regulator transcription factor n=1 Tax=Maridesulfovibrio bastinii TaxID=47157 RepID=UPI000484F162|nr:response regulator [Maridesulfovibrio bastinii]